MGGGDPNDPPPLGLIFVTVNSLVVRKIMPILLL